MCLGVKPPIKNSSKAEALSGHMEDVRFLRPEAREISMRWKACVWVADFSASQSHRVLVKRLI